MKNSMLTSCTYNSADNPVVTPRQRVINFEGIDNARDMGGLVMQDGRIVRFDMLVRSGKLAKATDADVAILQSQYHLSDVFDFRFDLEMTEAPEYRLSENFIVPYVDNVYPKDIIKKIIIGPCNDFERSTKSLQGWLHKIGMDHVQVTYSMLPYRNS